MFSRPLAVTRLISRRGLFKNVDRHVLKPGWSHGSIGRLRRLCWFLGKSANQCCASDQSVTITSQIGSCRTASCSPVTWNETKLTVIVDRNERTELGVRDRLLVSYLKPR